MIDWSTTALLFPGQGSQQVGMGADIAAKYPEAMQVFEQADAILDTAFSKLIFEGPAETLNLTYNTQPSMFVTSLAIMAAMRKELGSFKPAMVAGHSLGEFTALVVADVFDFEAGLKLVRERARLMGVAGDQHPGAMAAILGLDLKTAQEICASATAAVGNPVIVANDNCPGQIVISGDKEALEHASEQAKEAGAKRVLPLAVSVAAHSPLMESSARVFIDTILHDTSFQTPQIPIIGNANADFLTDPDIIRHELEVQITSSVRWSETMRKMLDNGVTTFLEIGSKSVLCGLLKRIDRSATGIPIEKTADIEKLMTS